MKVNFDNIRRKTTNEFNNLGDYIENHMNEYGYYTEKAEKVVAAYNNLRNMIIALNCLHDDEVADDVNDLADLNVKRI